MSGLLGAVTQQQTGRGPEDLKRKWSLVSGKQQIVGISLFNAPTF